MVAFFAAAAKAPISTIIMISEMTGGYGLLAPAMFAVVTAFILSGKKTIFPAQVPSRLDSPFHADEFEPIVLRRVKTSDVMTQLPMFVNSQAIGRRRDGSDGRLRPERPAGGGGTQAVRPDHACWRPTGFPKRNARPRRSRKSCPTEIYRAYPDEDLFTILKRFAAKDVGHLPVVTRENPDCPIGLITRSGLWTALEIAKEAKQQRAERK